MRLKLIVLLAGVAVVAGGAGWMAGLRMTPVWATDKMFATFIKGGARPNQLSPAKVRTAKTAKVVADNPDTLTRSSILDLSDGPVLFEADVPAGDSYWSISLFAHNTDTYFVANDRRVGAGPYRLLIRTRDQAVPERLQVDDVAVSPSVKSFLIIRAIMPDRNDEAGVEALRAQVMKERLTPVK